MQSIPRLETKRLRLRAIQPADAESVFRVFSDPQVTQFTDMGRLVDRQQALELISRYTFWFQNDQGVRWGIFLKSTEEMIGVCCFDTYLPHYHSANLGYDIASAFWGQGYATEAVSAICNYAFNHGLVSKINRLQAITHSDNMASARVLVKAGFQQEGVMRQYGYWRGQYHDMLLFSRLAERQD
jgi:ribosomal-protein-alanine N-acetyltransferase